MKKRIQFIYENSSDKKAFIMLLSAKDMKDLLNKKEYISSLEMKDRELLLDYIKIVEEVKRIKEELESKREELKEYKKIIEKQKIGLE